MLRARRTVSPRGPTNLVEPHRGWAMSRLSLEWWHAQRSPIASLVGPLDKPSRRPDAPTKVPGDSGNSRIVSRQRLESRDWSGTAVWSARLGWAAKSGRAGILTEGGVQIAPILRCHPGSVDTGHCETGRPQPEEPPPASSSAVDHGWAMGSGGKRCVTTIKTAQSRGQKPRPIRVVLL